MPGVANSVTRRAINRQQEFFSDRDPLAVKVFCIGTTGYGSPAENGEFLLKARKLALGKPSSLRLSR